MQDVGARTRADQRFVATDAEARGQIEGAGDVDREGSVAFDRGGESRGCGDSDGFAF